MDSSLQTVPATFSVEQIRLLLEGLTSFEGALVALQQPVPPDISRLKSVLTRQMEIPFLQQKDFLTAAEASRLMGLSTRRVRQLGQDQSIRLIRQGGRGRGRSNVYSTESIMAYLKQQPAGMEYG